MTLQVSKNTTERDRDLADAIDQEAAAYANFRRYLDQNRELLSLIAHHGDGECGALAAILREKLLPRGWA
ncbi:hypothetical protein [Pseudomonas sp. UBA6323]|uniref:hypothetical protein n=1 Tax=Pseudomonas sp. UBA6323 TaxID=1947329 RepID=UPI0025CFA52A|nr:hypothetical protein [Pseudomonas sp. UBA6323]